jgi:hypothetical protein
VGEARVSAGGSHPLTVFDAIYISLHTVNGMDDWSQLSAVATVPYLICKQTFQCEMANTNVAVQNVDSFHRPLVGYLVKGKTT